jgi:hypothetical protein
MKRRLSFWSILVLALSACSPPPVDAGRLAERDAIRAAVVSHKAGCDLVNDVACMFEELKWHEQIIARLHTELARYPQSAGTVARIDDEASEKMQEYCGEIRSGPDVEQNLIPVDCRITIRSLQLADLEDALWKLVPQNTPQRRVQN